MITRRSVLVAFGAGLGAAALPREGSATVARPVSLGELTHSSHHALLALPVSMVCSRQRGRYGTHLVTHTRLRVTRSLDGRPPASADLLLQTLGGRLDGVGEIVHGEAVPRIGKESLFFVYRIRERLHGVTAMAQGHYPVVRVGSADPVLRASKHLPRWPESHRAAATRAASVVLAGRSLPDAERLIFRELHGDAP